MKALVLGGQDLAPLSGCSGRRPRNSARNVMCACLLCCASRPDGATAEKSGVPRPSCGLGGKLEAQGEIWHRRSAQLGRWAGRLETMRPAACGPVRRAATPGFGHSMQGDPPQGERTHSAARSPLRARYLQCLGTTVRGTFQARARLEPGSMAGGQASRFPHGGSTPERFDRPWAALPGQVPLLPSRTLG